MVKLASTGKLLRTALLTAPLIAVIMFSPVLFTSSLHTGAFTPGKFVGVIFLTILILVLWMMNIGWYVFFAKREKTYKYERLYRYVLSFTSCYVLAALIFMLPPPPHAAAIPSPGLWRAIVPLIGITANNAIILIITDLIILRGKQEKMETAISDLTLKNVIAQNEQLKGQIHPHFLFNSLSTLKTLMKVSYSDAEKYLINLSSYLRTAISYSGEDKASLENELKHCTKYLEMQKMRFGNALNYDIRIPEEIQQHFYLPVFSLQMLSENAIKHNSLTKEKPLLIEIFQTDPNSITVKNNLNFKQVMDSTGLGLENLSKRVKLLEKSGNDINIIKTANSFCVVLPLIDS